MDTVRELTEGQLQQSQRLESLGQLAGGVAHDFNNLLAVILNYASFVAEELSDAADRPNGERWHAVAADVEQIRRAAERAAELTRRLLAVGRREVVRLRVLNINSVVVDVEQLLRRSIGSHVKLVTNLRKGLWSVSADPGQIEQILLNLAVNARDAMPEGGTLTIDTANITATDHTEGQAGIPAGRYVRLRVTDTGTGMDGDALSRAFEPFFTTKPKGEGSGLGLATVYGIVTHAGGHAQIHSTVGVGTTISAFIAATTEPLPPPEPRSKTRQRRGGETILVVEDEDAMLTVAARILVRHGHRVLTAGSGAEAISVARHHDGDIHLLLTDVVMPQMLGTELAERVRALRPGIRTLFMSGYAQPVLAVHGTLDAGVTLIEKPFSEAGLIAKAREVLDDDG